MTYRKYIFTGASLIALTINISAAHAAEKGKAVTAWDANQTTDDSDMVTTGVARARDRLSSATSTSSIKENEINKRAPRSLAELFRGIPGIRVEAGAGDTNNGYTVRGLPLVGVGSKYLQLQEDGLPVLEFGDIPSLVPDTFIRADLNVGQIDSIRGGSASTFASNAPGGVINLISKTGETEGGSVQLSAGLNYDSNRVDVDYGGHLSDTWRFHIGGFYREGEGARKVGYTANKGGQVKFNITKQFSGGYIRFNVKLLDDQVPFYFVTPVGVSGTDKDPHYKNVESFSNNRDSLLSRNLVSQLGFDTNGNVATLNLHDGYRAKAKSLGMEAQFTLADWIITERFRYADQSTAGSLLYPLVVAPAAGFLGADSLSYANGPQAGTAIDPANVNGNGLIALNGVIAANAPDMRNVTNDLRGSRVWQIGGSDLTTTAGIYKANQHYGYDTYFATIVQDVRGNGDSALVNLSAGGSTFTQNGTLAYRVPGATGYMQSIDVTYDVTAPYGSFNFQKGKFSIGGSLRYDYGRVNGSIAQDVGTRPIDIDGSGAIDPGPEGQVSVIARGLRQPVNYNYGYLSYSAGINYRIAEPLAAFVRYSRGARAAAANLLFSAALSPLSGDILNKSASRDPVRQAEAGIKFRKQGVSLSATGFHALTDDSSNQAGRDANGNAQFFLVSRSYKTYGAEVEGSVRRGPLSLNGSVTFTGGEITKAIDRTLIGNTPRHQAAVVYTVRPQYETDRFTIGADIIGQTSSYAQDGNLLKMPAYTTVGLFAQVRPVERLILSVNASNVFNALAITDVQDNSLPASGVTLARSLYGRLISTSARFFF